ncbi:hypothetical protein [Nonomuraea longicatena]|uniref:Uncharacterized protein n=1 Tax=Nonomuraea longicatena TaxID=83682 RepID=A0ABP4BGS3_9ACTN
MSSYSTLTVHKPRASEMSLMDTTLPKSHALYLELNGTVWVALNSRGSDLAAEIEAMERLADLATEAAARLRALSQSPAEAA